MQNLKHDQSVTEFPEHLMHLTTVSLLFSNIGRLHHNEIINYRTNLRQVKAHESQIREIVAGIDQLKPIHPFLIQVTSHRQKAQLPVNLTRELMQCSILLLCLVDVLVLLHTSLTNSVFQKRQSRYLLKLAY